MRRFCSILTGFLLMTQPLEASAQSSQSLYRQILDRVRNELTLGTAEDSVKKFVEKIFPDEQMSDEDIDAVLLGNPNEFCGSKGTRSKTYPNCETLLNKIRITTMAEAQVRMLGRDLQAIAAGYEFPIEGELGRFLDLPSQYNAIISIWRAGAGATATDSMALRTQLLDEKSIEEPLRALGVALNSLTEEERTAAVWRYRHGYRFVNGERQPPSAPVVPFHAESPFDDRNNGLNTERQYLFKRWDGKEGTQNIEEHLKKIWDEVIPHDPESFNPPLKNGEIVLFIFPPKIAERALPQNVLVWAHVESLSHNVPPGRGKDYEGYGYTQGDVGLQWHIPIDPVLPSLRGLKSKEPILGGQYPPNPIDESDKPLDGLGLCIHPVGRQGYLCRTRTLKGEECEEKIEPEPDTIILAKCSEKPPDTDRKTKQEQLVCPDISWKTEKKNGEQKDQTSETVCNPYNPDNFYDPDNRSEQDRTSYRNTIGNTACYIGQCIEESMRTHRLVSGRNTFVTQDAAYPWDPLMKSTTGGSLLTSPPLLVGAIPPYRPQRILNAFDESLCQSVGLPPRTPPALCMFNELRSLAFPTDFLTTASRLLVQTGEQFEPFFGLRNLAASIGTRISTELYAQYLQVATKSLVELMRSANIILKEIQKTSFPDEMCPTNFDLSQPQS